MKSKKMMLLAGISIVALVGTTACETAGQGTASGAAAGAALGAGSGALLARGHSGNGALIGGLAGAVAGGLIGNQLGANNQRNTRQDAAIGQALQDANTAVVNVPTSTGGVIPVRLERQGNVWVGPRGEMYTSMPSVDQLQRAYGF